MEIDQFTKKILKEFDEKFYYQPINRAESAADSYPSKESVKAFIKSSLLTQRNEIKERIEGMKDKRTEKDIPGLAIGGGAMEAATRRIEGYNQALEAARKAVDEEE